jgi:hypothetical protein
MTPCNSVLMLSTKMVIMLCLALTFIALCLPAYAQITSPSPPGIFNTNEKPYGIAYKDWTAKWWQWLMMIPSNYNPVNDNTGKNCGVGQNGPVWFLAGTGSATAVRSCDIPDGKAILYPVLNSQCDPVNFKDSRTESELRECAQADDNYAVTLQSSIDGHPIANLKKYRVTSSLFNISYAPNNIFGYVAANTTAVSDGYWVFLKPLSAGKHDIRFTGITSDNPTTGTKSFLVDVTYHINVVNRR